MVFFGKNLYFTMVKLKNVNCHTIPKIAPNFPNGIRAYTYIYNIIIIIIIIRYGRYGNSGLAL